MAMLTQCYSVRGLNVVAGLNISNTVNNVFNIVFIALGDSVAIVVGQLLGAGKMKEARDTDNKMIAFRYFVVQSWRWRCLHWHRHFQICTIPMRKQKNWQNILLC